MTDDAPARSAGDPTAYLEYLAAALAYLVAAVHLFHPIHGFERLVMFLTIDPQLLMFDPRPLAFVLSGVAILTAVPAVSWGYPGERAYLAGIALMATYLVGYFGWHLSGHGGFLPGREPLYHGLAPHEAVVAHLTGDPWAAVAVVAELALAGVLVVLYRRS